MTRFCSALFVSSAIFSVALAADEAPYGLQRRIPCDTSRLNGTPEPPPPYKTRRAFPKLTFNQPVYLIAEPGTDRLIVVTLANKALAFRDQPAIDKTEPYLHLPEHDLYGMTFHPQYEKNGQVFVFANGAGTKEKPRFNRIFRFEATGTPRTCDPKSKKLIIEWASNGHNGGDLGFGPDGCLYMTSGDGTSDSDGDVTGQDLRDLCSGVLRLDVDRPDPGKGYAIPKDNPFVGMKDARPELYAFGFRNPWRMTLDRKTGTFWIGDVGQDLWEMIHLLKRGGNYGWSVYEGGRPFYPNRKFGPGPLVPPAHVHAHSESRSITGGRFYAGQRPDLQDVYIYGDYATGKIWGLRHRAGKVSEVRELANSRLQMVGFGLDRKGELYIVDHAGGIYELETSPPPAAQVNWPRKLSETGLFASTAENRPHPGLIPYSVNSPLWSDGAFKERFIALPGVEPIEFSEDGFWKFPEGTVLVKTFALGGAAGKPASQRRIETRLMTFRQGEWQGYSYQWNEQQTDADLVPAKGTEATFAIEDPRAAGGKRHQAWHYPSRVECMVCHTRAANYVLGLSTMQMNREHDYGGIRDNQLRALEHVGALKTLPAEHLTAFETRCEALARTVVSWVPARYRDRAYGWVKDKAQPRWQPLRKELEEKLLAKSSLAKTLPRGTGGYKKLVDPADSRADSVARARSYLQANCAHCHVWAGGGNSAIDLHVNTTPEKMMLIGTKPLHDTFGLPEARLVAPGMPDRSVLLHRLATTGKGRMPPLASGIVDEEAVRLLRDWIKGLKALPAPKK